MAFVDLNSDLGESFGVWRLGDDASLLPRITSANIACGFHGGDPRVMLRTVREAARLGVGIGAHPGFPDLVGFGRRNISATPDEVYSDTLYQIGALHAFCQAHGTQLQHVKPHGQLNNMAFNDAAMARALASAVRDFSRELILVAYGGELLRAGEELGLPIGHEVFADRAYRADGSLVPRSEPGAMIGPDLIAARAVRMVQEGGVQAITGAWVALKVETICVHGDTPGAAALAGEVRTALEAAGIAVRPLREVLGKR